MPHRHLAANEAVFRSLLNCHMASYVSMSMDKDEGCTQKRNRKSSALFQG